MSGISAGTGTIVVPSSTTSFTNEALPHIPPKEDPKLIEHLVLQCLSMNLAG